MSQVLQLEIAEETYRVLAERAKREGKTPAELSAEIVARNLEAWNDDPLTEFIGKFDSGVTDAADNHDRYLGEALLKSVARDNRSASQRNCFLCTRFTKSTPMN